jgi:hypothetical protein
VVRLLHINLVPFFFFSFFPYSFHPTSTSNKSTAGCLAPLSAATTRNRPRRTSLSVNVRIFRLPAHGSHNRSAAILLWRLTAAGHIGSVEYSKARGREHKAIRRKLNQCISITYLLTYGAESFLRSCQLCSHSGNSQQF